MTANNNTKIVIIGLGYLMEYIRPCYEAFFGRATAAHIIGITADAADLARKQSVLGFEVRLPDRAAETLRSVRPEIVLFAPPPSVAPALVFELLAPYFEQLRAEGAPLPDLYLFPPDPPGSFYLTVLGDDVHVVNILPNMFKEIQRPDGSAMGYTVLTFPHQRPWDTDRRNRLNQFFAALGPIHEVVPEQVMPMLAGMVVCHNLSDALFSVMDGLAQDAGRESLAEVAAMMGRLYRGTAATPAPAVATPTPAPAPAPVSATAAPLPAPAAALETGLQSLVESWYDGISSYLHDVGMEATLVQALMVPQIEIQIQLHQIESREAIEAQTRQHATRGGVLEKGCTLFAERLAPEVRRAFAGRTAAAFDQHWRSFIRDGVYALTHAVAEHGKTLSARALPEFEIEHHAVLFGMFARETEARLGATGLEAIEAGVARYGRQRGSRMAQRATRDGERLDFGNYLCYGEWKARPGQMEIAETALSPDYRIAIRRCEWNESWQRHGLGAYGHHYCRMVDTSLVQGFSPDLHLGTDAFLSAGADHCSFTFHGLDFGPERKARIAAKTAAAGTANVMDFGYHSAHLFHALTGVLRERCGAQAQPIIAAVLTDYARKFGADRARFLVQSQGQDFERIPARQTETAAR